MKPNEYFKNKVIVITGAGSGIGKALCEEISQFSPQKIILVDINEDALCMIQQSLMHVDTDIYPVDVSSEQHMRVFFESIIEKNGRLDVVFNNAGIAAGGEFQDYSFEEWEKLLNINLWGVIYGSTFAYRQMLLQQHGHIVNTASLGGLIPEPMASVYATTKHGVVGLTTTLREEARAYGIKVSVACPGVIRTPIFDTATFAGNVDRQKVKDGTLEHGAISATDCARRIIAGVTKNKGVILVKPVDYVFWILYRMSPGILSPINRYIAKYFRENFRNK